MPLGYKIFSTSRLVAGYSRAEEDNAFQILACGVDRN